MLYLVITAVALYGAFIAALYFGQRKLLYNPNQKISAPADYGVTDMSVVQAPTLDGLTLHAWWRAPTNSAKPVIIYFHGNAGQIGDRADKVRPYLDAGYGVLLMSYRYNAGAGGTPSEAGLFLDGEAAIKFASSAGYNVERLIMYGESLGTGVAVEMAARHRVAALVLEAPYTDMGSLAQHHYWYAPSKWLLKDRFASIKRIGRNQAPVFFFHGARDRLIPIQFGRALFDVASAPKAFREFDDAAHNDLYDHGAAKAVLEFLKARVTP